MITAFVIGNGTSRRGISLDLLKSQGKIYGCNALYREFTPDCLVATDKPIATSIQESGYAMKNVFYTRKPIENLGARKIPLDYYSYSSGPVAMGIAAIDGHKLIYMLGFDMGPDQDKLYNNYYADTDFYRKSGSTPIYTGNWIKQIKTIAKKFPSTRFIRVMGPTTAEIEEFNNQLNIEKMTLSTFLERINTGRNP